MGAAAKTTEALPLLPDLLHPDRWLLWLGVLFVLSVFIVGKLPRIPAKALPWRCALAISYRATQSAP